MFISRVDHNTLKQALAKANQLTVNGNGIKFWDFYKVGEDKFHLHLIPNHKSMYDYDCITETRHKSVSWVAYLFFFDALFDIEPNAHVEVKGREYKGKQMYELNYTDEIKTDYVLDARCRCEDEEEEDSPLTRTHSLAR